MARLILKSPYLKPGGKKSPGGYLKYIATREGVEMAEPLPVPVIGMGEVLNITAFCGSLRRLSFSRHYRQVENRSHRDHCVSRPSAQ